MRTSIKIILATFLICVVTALITPEGVSAQTTPVPPGAAPGQSAPGDEKDVPAPTYNPYPPGIVPSDIDSELARVIREVDFIEKRSVERWKALKPLTFTGQPPTIQGNGTEAIETLGELMNYDRNISPGRNTACASCHMPYVAFSGPIPSVNLTMVAYPGTFRFRAGKRTAQRYPYAPFFPVLQFNEAQGTFFGGNFWDARSTGYLLRNPDAEQAQHPPVDTQEMGNPDTACIAFKLSQAVYRPLFEQLYGADSLNIKFPPETEEFCELPGGAKGFGTDVTPVKLDVADRAKANEVFNHWGQAIDAYEQSVQVSAFSSKFDAFLAGNYTMTADEMAGYDLFRGKAGCNTCHLDGRGSTQTAGTGAGTTPSTTTGTDTSKAALANPLFTCFGQINLGVPLNPRDAIFYQNTPDSLGFTANPFGFGFRDLGMGTFLRSGPGAAPNPNASWTQFAPARDGRMQVSTARNVGMAPPQCPTTEAPGAVVNGQNVGYFQKEFFHNGYIKSLKQLVHFYNTRDVFKFDVTSGHCPTGKTEKVDCWPSPEVPNNLNMTIGNLGLSDTEENQVVAFLQTLTDGFTKPYPNSDTFTGKCTTGGTAATQGNASLIPTPALPPCAAAICGVAPLPTKPIP
jgi:cytochrome c peroxidase